MKFRSNANSEGRSEASSWSPLQHRLFRMLWLATLASYIGNWMQVVGVAWLVATLTPSPALVSMAQGATHLALFLLYLPAGVAADLIDRRRLLLFSQTWMLANAGLLAVLTFTGIVSVPLVLAITFLIGLGAAIAAPAWQASIPDFVPESEFPAAVALESVAINIARALGPALGGLAFLLFGPAIVFLINAASFLGITYAIFRWRPQPHDVSAIPITFVKSLTVGVQALLAKGRYRAILIRTLAFVTFASCIWTLIPVVVRDNLQLGAGAYGISLGCLGLGAVIGAVLLPSLRLRVTPDHLFLFSNVIMVGSLLATAITRNYILLDFALIPGGAAWLVIVATLTVSLLAGTAPNLRGRMLAGFLAAFSAGYTGGSIIWGVIAARWTVSTSLMIASGGLLVASLLTSALSGKIIPGVPDSAQAAPPLRRQ
jgi:predicted MFS family arabinose efflux permease